MNILKRRRPMRRLGLVAAVAVAFGAVTAAPAPARTGPAAAAHRPAGTAADQLGGTARTARTARTAQVAQAAARPPAAKEEAKQKSGGSLWLVIGGGLVIGVGIGIGIVFRATRGHRSAGGRD